VALRSPMFVSAVFLALKKVLSTSEGRSAISLIAFSVIRIFILPS